MKIGLVNTATENNKFRNVGFFVPPYWAAILARKIRERGHEAFLLDLQFDEPKRLNVKKKCRTDADAIFISGMLPSYPQMMEVSRFYQEMGMKVILGGWGPTAIYCEFHDNRKMLDEHILSFCDAAVIGEAETAITGVLKDLENGMPAGGKLYFGRPEEVEWVMPDFSVWTEKYPLGTVQTQRGCYENCKFCSVTGVLGPRVRAKPVDFVRKEIELLLDGHSFDLIFFCDDNILAKEGGKYARELFTMFKDRFPKTSWMSQCTTGIIHQPDTIRLFGESNCVMLFIGFESLSAVDLTRKNFRSESDEEREKKYKELVRMLIKHGIEVWGSFIYGFENDTEKTLERTIDFALESGMLLFQMPFLTPLAGTALFREEMTRGNLLHPLTPENWGRYDFAQPTLKRYNANMDNESIERGIRRAYGRFYREARVVRRAWKSRIPKSYLVANLKPIIRWGSLKLKQRLLGSGFR